MKGQYKTKISKFLINSLFLVGTLLYLNPVAQAQYSKGQMIDKIIAKVDDYIVLKSDLDRSYLEYVSSGQEGGEEVKCGIFESAERNEDPDPAEQDSSKRHRRLV